ncbi:hypothetical protein SAMN05216206_2756 [Pseudomonas guineae]|uniref:Uncharacterized protein n=1 Tax=Pseudomonas guineae TaxID=425504 RepID=A0A1I3K9C0_9PSED|nr:hypothetical protein [Pseudomonas guineae]SFI69092.1 hypothetical protein SAMN05216206_2756 [Pseudomonas guineae]
MATKQHIYEGVVPPTDTFIAETGSHYIDTNNGTIWFAVDSGVYEGVPYTYWSEMKVVSNLLPPVQGGGFGTNSKFDFEGVLDAGSGVNLGNAGTIYTNVTIQVSGTGERSYTVPGSEPCYYKANSDGAGNMLFMVTPLNIYVG